MEFKQYLTVVRTINKTTSEKLVVKFLGKIYTPLENAWISPNFKQGQHVLVFPQGENVEISLGGPVRDYFETWVELK